MGSVTRSICLRNQGGIIWRADQFTQPMRDGTGRRHAAREVTCSRHRTDCSPQGGGAEPLLDRIDQEYRGAVHQHQVAWILGTDADRLRPCINGSCNDRYSFGDRRLCGGRGRRTTDYLTRPDKSRRLKSGRYEVGPRLIPLLGNGVVTPTRATACLASSSQDRSANSRHQTSASISTLPRSRAGDSPETSPWPGQSNPRSVKRATMPEARTILRDGAIVDGAGANREKPTWPCGRHRVLECGKRTLWPCPRFGHGAMRLVEVPQSGLSIAFRR